MDHPDFSDANYLLGAMVQSGAALVAIIGGVLGARYVSLHSEKSSTSHQLEQAHSVHEAALSEFRTADEGYGRAAVERFVYDPARFRITTIEGGAESVLDGLNKTFDWNEAALERGTQLVRNIAQAASESKWGNEMDSTARDLRQWPEARAVLHRPGSDELITLQVYYNSVVQMLSDLGIDWSDHMLVAGLKYELNQLFKEREERLEGTARAAIEARTTARASLKAAEDSVLAAEAHLDRLGAGEGFVLSIQVLGVVAILTVASPLVLMIPGLYVIDLWVKSVFVFLFLAGFWILGRYLWVYSAFLTDRIEAMPRHAFGLFRKLPKRSKGSRSTAKVGG